MKSSFESRAQNFPRFFHELDVDLGVDVKDGRDYEGPELDRVPPESTDRR